MMLGVVAFSNLLVWLVTTWALHQYFDEVGRAIIEDDLREYAEIYERKSIKAVERLHRIAGHSEHEQGVRLLGSNGETLIDQPIQTSPAVGWPEFPSPHGPGAGEVDWQRIELQGSTVLTLGRTRLVDGGELWFARTNTADLAAIHRVHNLLSSRSASPSSSPSAPPSGSRTTSCAPSRS